jgi:hypothetical protein
MAENTCGIGCKLFELSAAIGAGIPRIAAETFETAKDNIIGFSDLFADTTLSGQRNGILYKNATQAVGVVAVGALIGYVGYKLYTEQQLFRKWVWSNITRSHFIQIPSATVFGKAALGLLLMASGVSIIACTFLKGNWGVRDATGLQTCGANVGEIGLFKNNYERASDLLNKDLSKVRDIYISQTGLNPSLHIDHYQCVDKIDDLLTPLKKSLGEGAYHFHRLSLQLDVAKAENVTQTCNEVISKLEKDLATECPGFLGRVWSWINPMNYVVVRVPVYAISDVADWLRPNHPPIQSDIS